MKPRTTSTTPLGTALATLLLACLAVLLVCGTVRLAVEVWP